MIKRSRKPVCPSCHGEPYRAATHIDPAEGCQFCRGAAVVCKRRALRYLNREKRGHIHPLPAALRL